jgi:uncharacterized protein
MESNASLEDLSVFTILTVPGLDGSGADHWQSRWEFRLSNCRRVQMGDWANPLKSHWVERLDRALRSATQPVLLVAHSLGCLAVAHWAAQRWSPVFQDVVTGALLVAPPDVERESAPRRIQTFSPVPREPLPFPTLLVASHDDPFASFETSARIAQMWNSDLVDAGYAGHINAQSCLREWSEGLRLLTILGQRAAARLQSGLQPQDGLVGSIGPRGLAISDPV